VSDYQRVSGVKNEPYRDLWVRDALRRAAVQSGATSILDVGAGSSPFAATCKALGLRYVAHDFAQYDGTGDDAGLQCGTWKTSGYDVTCDILDIPLAMASDLVLCTEVLEHVPDPIRALERMGQLVKPSGSLIVTVPFMSFMHQAPFWFQSGLSPYWFEYWVPRVGLSITELVVTGDYVDFVDQELDRVSRGVPLPARVRRPLRRMATRALSSKCPPALRVSAGFGTFCVAKAG
jgi:SAM-dependent methyltransferase